jgi:transmembrane sensor
MLHEVPHVALGDAAHADTDASWRALADRIRAEGADDLSVRRHRVAAADAQRSAVRPLRWVRGKARIAAALLICASGTAAWLTLRQTGGSVSAPRGQDVATRLPDGTRLTLAAGSTVTWTAAFGKRSRDVDLQGEVLFDVVHDAARPFRVHARDAVARDIGTRFVVRAWAEQPAVDVAVEIGLVALAASGRASADSGTLLHAGQRGRLNANGSVAVTQDADAVLAWTHGVLTFDNQPLAEVLPAIGRRFDVEVRADSSLLARHLSARFAAQSLTEVLNALAVSLDVRVTTSGRVVTVSPAVP